MSLLKEIRTHGKSIWRHKGKTQPSANQGGLQRNQHASSLMRDLQSPELCVSGEGLWFLWFKPPNPVIEIMVVFEN